MRKCSALHALFIVLGIGSPALAQPDGPPVDAINDKFIGALIDKLGSPRFQERAAAQKQLEALGAPALGLLKKAIQSDDLEVSKRAGEVVRKIEERIFAPAMLAPKRVRLQATDVSALDAIAELAKASGYSIHLAGLATPANKKITLGMGELTFWQALDALCTQAGLVEQLHASNSMTGNGQPDPFSVLPNPKAQPAAAAAAALKIALAQALQAQGQVRTEITSDPRGVGASTLGAITLLPGTTRNEHLSHAGAVRSRLYALPRDKSLDYRLMLEASAEPRLQGFTIVGNPTIDKALDEQGRDVILNREAMGEKAAQDAALAAAEKLVVRSNGVLTAPPRQHAILHFKPGEQASKTLAELRGSFTVQVKTAPEPLVTIDKVLASSGTTAKGKSGELLQLHDIRVTSPNEYKIHVVWSLPQLVAQRVVFLKAAVVQVVGSTALRPASDNWPLLLDAKGNKLAAGQIQMHRISTTNGIQTLETTMFYRRQEGVGEPDRLVLNGTRMASISVPFAFHNVPLE